MSGSDTEDNGAAKRSKARKVAVGGLALLFLSIGAVWGGWLFTVGQYRETTDNAYVTGNVYHVEPLIPGVIVWMGADEMDYVEEGQALVRLENSDLAISLEKARADLLEEIRNTLSGRARVAQLKARAAFEEAGVNKARDELVRRKELINARAISREDLESANAAFEEASAKLDAARWEQEAARVLLGDGDVANHPSVLKSIAALKEAYLNTRRAVVVAPVSGYIAKRAGRVGQLAVPGKPLMSVIPMNDLSIDANFKETQLDGMRIGQPAAIISDLYGKKAKYKGKVAGFGAGTGGVFALLPAQNATGNWIKVVQRAPVRISLDRDEYEKAPLILGLSMTVTVDTEDRTGEPLGAATGEARPISTTVFRDQAEGMDEYIRKVMEEGIGADGAREGKLE